MCLSFLNTNIYKVPAFWSLISLIQNNVAPAVYQGFFFWFLLKIKENNSKMKTQVSGTDAVVPVYQNPQTDI